MKDLKFRTLRADEIEVRPATIQNGKATLLLYVDSRSVVNLLNETVGAMNWQTEFYEVAGQVVGKLGIYDEDRQIWVWKSDVGSESNIEATKGLFSDCYKRMLSRFGVQELYSAPRIIIDDDGYKNVGYKVSEISYDENRNITHLVIVNRFNREAFRWDANAPTSTTYQPTPISVPTGLKTGNTGTFDHLAEWDEYCKKKVETGQADRETVKVIYRRGKEEAQNNRYAQFWPSSLYKRLEQTS